MSEPRWHIRHKDGRNWALDEMEEEIRRDHERNGVKPHDVGLFAVAVGDDDCAYLLDNLCVWHWPRDMEVVWDE